MIELTSALLLIDKYKLPGAGLSRGELLLENLLGELDWLYRKFRGVRHEYISTL
jgi:hypothetical protein